jgi:hypothetical protein
VAEGDSLPASKTFINFSFSTALSWYALMLLLVRTASKTSNLKSPVQSYLAEPNILICENCNLKTCFLAAELLGFKLHNASP